MTRKMRRRRARTRLNERRAAHTSDEYERDVQARNESVQRANANCKCNVRMHITKAARKMCGASATCKYATQA